ncbi:hypothetical protein H8959_007014 [Pygathrix nigripes]
MWELLASHPCNACQDCAKRKLEENGIEVSKKLRQSDTGIVSVLFVGSCLRSVWLAGIFRDQAAL